jgi:hypothetical protein
MKEFYKNNYKKLLFRLFIYNNSLAKRFGKKEFIELPLWRQHLTFFGVLIALIIFLFYVIEL